MQFWKNKLLAFGLMLMVVITFHSCFGVKPQATKSGKHLYETFYVGEKGTQYFIKPLLWIDSIGESQMYVDITFRYKNEVKDSASIKISIISPNSFREMNKVEFSSKSQRLVEKNINLLFFQAKKKLVESRYEMKIPLKDVIEYFSDPELKVSVANDKSELNFHSPPGTKKNIDKLNTYVFNLMK